MDVRICKQCGHETENSLFFMFNKRSCPNCGGNDFIISPAPPNYEREGRSTVRKKIIVVFKILILVFTVLGMIFFGMFMYYFFKALGLF